MHEAIKALRDDQVSQRVAQRALESAKQEWQSHACGRLLDDLELYGSGRELSGCPALAQPFRSSGLAEEIVSGLVGLVSNALQRNPLGQVPFRHQYQPGIGVLQLASSGNAVLSLVLYERRDIASPRTVCFTDNECSEIVLSGRGCARILELQERASGVAISKSALDIAAGSTLQIGEFAKTKQIVSVDEPIVLLRLSRTPAHPRQSREYRLDDCALLHRAMGDRKESRQEMFVTLLGAMGHSDAVPVFEDMSRLGGVQLRWQAMRNCLALDSEAGFRMLSAVANNSDDTLAAAATALRGELLAAHPQFAKLEVELCPA